MIFGVLPWRFHVWVSGKQGSGKSKTLEWTKDFLNHAVFTKDTTAAGLIQKFKCDQVPIIYDEFEPPKKPLTSNQSKIRS